MKTDKQILAEIQNDIDAVCNHVRHVYEVTKDLKIGNQLIQFMVQELRLRRDETQTLVQDIAASNKEAASSNPVGFKTEGSRFESIGEQMRDELFGPIDASPKQP